jgi:hypothetical protein
VPLLSTDASHESSRQSFPRRCASSCGNLQKRHTTSCAPCSHTHLSLSLSLSRLSAISLYARAQHSARPCSRCALPTVTARSRCASVPGLSVTPPIKSNHPSLSCTAPRSRSCSYSRNMHSLCGGHGWQCEGECSLLARGFFERPERGGLSWVSVRKAS